VGHDVVCVEGGGTFVDQDKITNLSEVLLWFHMCTSEYENLIRDYPSDLDQYMRVIKPRMGGGVCNTTFLNAGTSHLLTFNPNTKHRYFSI
jgi:hypothetical protein